MLKQIYFVSNEQKLREMAYGDSVYAWLLLHSHYDPDEEHNYIYKRDFTFEQIGKDIGRTRQTVSSKFKALLELSQKEEKQNGKNLIYYSENNKCYYLPCFRVFEKLDAQTVLNLFRICAERPRREEVIKTYVWLKKQYKNGNKNISYNDLIAAFGHSKGNEQIYNRYKDVLTTLQGAGLITFRTDKLNFNFRNDKGQFDKTMYITKVNDKASQSWLDSQEEADKR